MQTEQQNGVCPKHISHLTSLQATIIAVAGWLLKRDSRKTAKFVLHLQAAVSANFCAPHVLLSHDHFFGNLLVQGVCVAVEFFPV